jgi:hypothetical protein
MKVFWSDDRYNETNEMLNSRGMLRLLRFSLRDEVPSSAVPLALPQRRMWPAGLIVGSMFVIFASIEWTTFRSMSRHNVRDVTDLMFVLFQGFWLLGWLVGVLILGAFTILLCFYGESARLQNGRLLFVPHLGPLKFITEYDLARIRNVRLEPAGADGRAKIRFDYGDESDNTLGDVLPVAEGERIVEVIKNAAASASPSSRVTVQAPAAQPRQEEMRRVPAVAPRVESNDDSPATPMTLVSSLALVAANLIPLAGVLFFGWDLASVMVLFWAESGVIAFYTALKMIVVGKVFAIFGVPFFVAHFGGFMAIHFLLIYELFVRGIHPVGPEPAVGTALLRIFGPLWPSLAALFLSHGISFVTNFIGRREYERSSMSALMSAPYTRIIVMQLTLIFGGWVILLLNTPVPALAILIVVKTVLDFTAHQKEHKKAPGVAIRN